jgi:hypothetical protein
VGGKEEVGSVMDVVSVISAADAAVSIIESI